MRLKTDSKRGGDSSPGEGCGRELASLKRENQKRLKELLLLLPSSSDGNRKPPGIPDRHKAQPKAEQCARNCAMIEAAKPNSLSFAQNADELLTVGT
jgi:hypothetical protein